MEHLPYCGAVQSTAKAALPLGAQPVTMPLEPAAAPARLSSTASAPPPESGPETWTDEITRLPVDEVPPPPQEAIEPPTEELPDTQPEESTEQPAEDLPELQEMETTDQPASDDLDASEESETEPEPKADTLPFEFD